MSAALDKPDSQVKGSNDTPTATAGARKAAIALMMLGEELAGEVLRRLNEHEVEHGGGMSADTHALWQFGSGLHTYIPDPLGRGAGPPLEMGAGTAT